MELANQLVVNLIVCIANPTSQCIGVKHTVMIVDVYPNILNVLPTLRI